MTGLIIATHGEMAKAALGVAEMLMGEQEAVETIGFNMGDSLEVLLNRFQDALQALESCEEILIMTDIKGGSPCNAATVMKSQRPDVRVIAGVSVPMLVQFFENRYSGMPVAESVATVLEAGQSSISEITII